MAEPVADATRALLDGHVCLSRHVANRGLFPAVDVLASASRLLNQIASREHLDAVRQVTALLAAYAQAEDLIRIGAYQPGSDPMVDRARRFLPIFEKFVQQGLEDEACLGEAIAEVIRLPGSNAPPARVQRGES
jgi:flagellum-specific ATP synthase